MSMRGFRKFACLLIAGMLALQLCVPCFAETASTDGAVEGNTADSEDEYEGLQSGTDSLEELGKMVAENRVDRMVEGMTTREKVGQMIVAAFRGWSGGANGGSYYFTEMNDEVRASISKNRFGGVLLFAENCENSEKTLKLVNEMQLANQDTDSEYKIPLLFSIDQEGGIVYRLGQGTQWTGNMAIAATGDPVNARVTGREIGKELSALSINTNFGVVLDVNDNPENPIIGVRAFSDDTATVSDYGKALLEGMTEGGTIAVLKHFPGHGNTSTDSHTGLPKVEKTLDELNGMELVPFRTGIEAGAEMIMTAHIQYPEIEKETYTSKSTGEQVVIPATLSKTILTDILREKMGFDGVVITDALEMDALTEHFKEEDVYKMAINAGVDMILVPCTVYGPDSLKKLEKSIDTIVKMVEKGEISKTRLDESVSRILTLKARHGLLESDFTKLTDKEIAKAAAKVGTKKAGETEWEMMKKGLTLLKNEDDTLPRKLKENEKVLVLYPGQSRVNTADYAKQRLEEEKVIPQNTEWETMVYDPDIEEKCLEAVRNADHVIAVTTMFEVEELDPENYLGESGRVLDHIIEAAHAADKQITLISAELPYDVARYPDVDAAIVTYGSTRMLDPAGSGQSVSANLPGAICAVFGGFTPQGTLPVNLPAIKDDYTFSDEILYPFGFSAVKAAEEEKTKKAEEEKAAEEKKAAKEEKAETAAEESGENTTETAAEASGENTTEKAAEESGEN